MIWKRRKNGPVTDEQWERAWRKPDQLPQEKKQQLLDAIHHRIHTAAGYRRRVIYIGAGAVAAMVVAFIVRFNWVHKSEVPVTEWSIIASNDYKKKVELADGSVIWLAPHSSVRYYPAFAAQRSVILDKGTAFFTVAKDEAHPFSIAVNRQQVRVLGTAFTIARKDTVDLHLLVKEGTVALNNQKGQLIVHGGEQVSTFNAIAGNIETTPAMTADWWLQQQVRLFDVPLGELLNNIEAYYHVKLNTGNIKRKTKVTLTWDFTQSLKNNLEVLNQLTGNTIH